MSCAIVFIVYISRVLDVQAGIRDNCESAVTANALPTISMEISGVNVKKPYVIASRNIDVPAVMDVGDRLKIAQIYVGHSGIPQIFAHL